MFVPIGLGEGQLTDMLANLGITSAVFYRLSIF